MSELQLPQQVTVNEFFLFLVKQSSNSFWLTLTQYQLLLGNPVWLKLSQIHIVVYILFYIRKNKTNAFQGNIIVIFLFTLQLCTTEIRPTSVVTFHQLHRLWQFYKTCYLFVLLFVILSIAIAIAATIHPACCSRMMRTVIIRILSAFFRFWLQPVLLKPDSFISFNLIIFAPKWAQL